MTGEHDDRTHWTRAAQQWIDWARAPGHDAFWAYRETLGDFVGPGPGEALEVGCGEGRIARLLTGNGWRVTATDAVEPLVEAAREANSAAAYAVAPADALPFADAAFDLVMAYNVLMDVADVPASITEIARVLKPGGTLVVSIVHPFADFETLGDPDADYFVRRPFEAEVESNGLTMHFAGWSQPLQAYASALENAGLAITSLSEPRVSSDAAYAHLERWQRLPLFLWLKAKPLAG